MLLKDIIFCRANDTIMKKKFTRQSENTPKNLANKITVARILAIPIFIIILCVNFKYNYYSAALVFVILASLDWLDGYVARKYDQVTAVGAMLDPLADKLLVSAALIFLIDKGVDAWMAYVILARELIITGLRSLVMAKGGNMPARVSGKVKTVSQIIAIVTVLLAIPYSWYFMLAATIITIYSGIEYLWVSRRVLKDIL
jgi:CDP-diacylglycerol--glycerol-3-phosphate 3-phosphatidyltransferase